MNKLSGILLVLLLGSLAPAHADNYPAPKRSTLKVFDSAQNNPDFYQSSSIPEMSINKNLQMQKSAVLANRKNKKSASNKNNTNTTPLETPASSNISTSTTATPDIAKKWTKRKSR